MPDRANLRYVISMNRAEIINKIKAAEPQLRAHGIAGLYLFGSYARDEAQPDSDVDVFIDKVPGRRFGFDELMGGYFALKDAVPRHQNQLWDARRARSIDQGRDRESGCAHFLMASKNPLIRLGHIRTEIERRCFTSRAQPAMGMINERRRFASPVHSGHDPPWSP